MIKENLQEVQRRVQAACDRAGRAREDVLLIAVSKTKPVEMIRQVMETGIVDYGENKVQEMCDKMEVITEPLNWHLIGHLQRNKVKYIVDKACMIHSVDSLRLAEEIQKEAEKKGVEKVKILIEVNMAEEDTKDGIHAEETEVLVKAIAALPNLQIMGLMTIAPFVDDPEENRPVFKAMVALKDRIDALQVPGVLMQELSMGMTNDYEVAIEEGATMIRVGTAIFGERYYANKN